MLMWHLGTWFTGGFGSTEGMVGLSDPEDLFNINNSIDSPGEAGECPILEGTALKSC